MIKNLKILFGFFLTMFSFMSAIVADDMKGR